MQTTTFNNAQQSTVAISEFKDIDGLTTTAPSGVPVWQLVDDFGNAPADKGVLILTPASDGQSANLSGVAAGSQRIHVNVGSAGAAFVVTVTAMPAPGPAVTMVLTFSTPIPKT